MEKHMNMHQEAINLYWRTLAKARGMHIYTSDIEWTVSDDRRGPERIFCSHIPPENAGKRIDEIVGDIKKGTLPGSLLFTTEDISADMLEALKSRGFEIDTSNPCMILELPEYDIHPKGSDYIHVIEATDEEALRKWVDIVNMDDEIMSYEQFYDIYLLPETHFYIAFYDHIPAGIGMIIVSNGFATLEMVNTVKEFRRKGVATALLSHAFTDLIVMGIGKVYLRSSLEGIRLYEKMGFKECCKRIMAIYDVGKHQKLDEIARLLDANVGEKQRMMLMNGEEKVFSGNPVESAEWMHLFMERLSKVPGIDVKELFGAYCPCYIEKASIVKAKEILDSSPDIRTFVSNLEEKRIIGRKLWYSEAEATIYISKRYACDCGGGYAEGNSLISERCHCSMAYGAREYMPMDFCQCAARFFYPMFGGLFGSGTVIEPVETVLSGGKECIFAIRLPESKGKNK